MLVFRNCPELYEILRGCGSACRSSGKDDICSPGFDNVKFQRWALVLFFALSYYRTDSEQTKLKHNWAKPSKKLQNSEKRERKIEKNLHFLTGGAVTGQWQARTTYTHGLTARQWSRYMLRGKGEARSHLCEILSLGG